MLKQSPAKDSRPQTSDSKAQAGAADTPRRGGTLPPYAEYERNTRCPEILLKCTKNTSEACAQKIMLKINLNPVKFQA